MSAPRTGDAMQALPFHIRNAEPHDIASLMRLKRLLAASEDATHVVCASADDWLRDGFGPQAGFTAFVADQAGAVIGMATCSTRRITGWVGPVVFLQDLFVEPGHRNRGVANALAARVAAHAQALGSPIIELTVRADNPAQDFYQRAGFAPLPHCLTYVLSGPALTALARQDASQQGNLSLAG